MKDKNFYFALFTLTGTIIGAGIFGIPYVVAKSGLIPCLLCFLILGLSVLLIHLFFGEIVLETKERHRLPGYAQKYLGRGGKILVTISTVLGLTGAILAYTIIGGQFLRIVCLPVLNLPTFYFSLVFWLIFAFFVFRGIKLIASVELVMNIIFFLVIFLIFVLSFSKINIQNIKLLKIENIFLPYGVILFSLTGWAAVPGVSEIIRGPEKKKRLRKVIVTGILISVVLYLLFSLVVVGISGNKTSSNALQGLLPFLGKKIIILGAIFGITVIATSFLVLGNYLKNTLFYDYGLSKHLSFFIACGLPLFLFLIGFRSFIGTIGFVGTINGTIEGIVIALIFKKICQENRSRLKNYLLLIYCLIAVFIFGMISQIIYFLKGI